MSWGTPSIPQIRDRVKALRDKGRTSAIIGFHAGGNYEGPQSFSLNEETSRLRRAIASWKSANCWRRPARTRTPWSCSHPFRNPS